MLIELPNEEYDHFTSLMGNGQSRLLQSVKDAILSSYPNTNIRGDGQVVVVTFSDGMRFEILPAFQNSIIEGYWDGTYKYPDTHMGGNWMTTNPKAEQEAMPEYKDLVLFDFSSNIRTVKKWQILIVENKHSRFAAIKLGPIESAGHGHHHDEMEFDYHIYYDELLDGRI